MIETKIKVTNQPYPVYIGRNLIRNLDSLLIPYIRDQSIFLLTEQNVFNFYGELIIETLKGSGTRFNYFVIPAGEKSKSIDSYNQVIGELTKKRYNRISTLIAVGGGMIGDLGGFIASTYMRGIDLIHVPTTFLSQVDSSIGGKTGINYEGFKNLLGTFYHPRAVITDTDTLSTLQKREYLAAFGEVIKYGMLGDYDLLVDLNQNHTEYLNRNVDLDKVILKCIKMKEKIVVEDVNDLGLRQTLNLGHTFAHGIESSTGFKQFYHGEAVAIGLLFATALSLELGLIKEDYHNLIKNIICKYFPETFKYELNAEEIIKSMVMDKKNKNTSITFVLPVGKEKVKIFNDISIEIVRKTFVEAMYGFSSK